MPEVNKPSGRRWLRVVAWIVLVPLALLLVLAAGVVVANLMDEDLKPETKALMSPPAMGKADDRNGYVDFLGMGAPLNADLAAWGRKTAEAYAAQAAPGFRKTPQWEEQVKAHVQATKEAANWCSLEKEDCLALAKYGRDARLANAQNDEILRRYRVVRAKPEFADVSSAVDVTAIVPSYAQLLNGAALSRLDIALKAVGGDIGTAVAELEREVAFHRRMLEGGRTLVTVVVGSTLLSRDLLLASELIRTGGEAFAPYRARMVALAGPASSMQGLDAGMRNDVSAGMSHLSGLRAKMRETRYREAAGLMQTAPSATVASSVSLLVRDNETLNLLAARYTEAIAVAKTPPASLAEARRAMRARSRGLEGSPWSGPVNPVGRGLVELLVPEFASFAARMHDAEALRRMVHLQAMMAEKGIFEPDAMAAFVAGEAANKDADPYTGKPFTFDKGTKRLSFTPAGGGATVTALQKRYDGRFAIEL